MTSKAFPPDVVFTVLFKTNADPHSMADARVSLRGRLVTTAETFQGDSGLYAYPVPKEDMGDRGPNITFAGLCGDGSLRIQAYVPGTGFVYGKIPAGTPWEVHLQTLDGQHVATVLPKVRDVT